MEERTTVVIDIQLDENQVADRLAAVNQEMADVRRENSDLKKEVKDGTKTWRDISVQLAENEARLKSLKAEQSALTGQVSQATQKNRQYGTSLKEQSAQLNELRDRYKSLNKEERDSAAGQEMLRHIQDLDAALKEADYSQGQFQRNVGNYPDAVKPVTAQLKEMTDQLIKMRMEGKAGTQEYADMAAEAGRLKDAMVDTSNEVERMASDTAGLDSALNAAQLAAGGFSAALGVMNLLGDKDSKTAKELAEAQQKLQAAIAITTGLQSVQNALQKESNLMLGIGRVQAWAAAKANDALAAANGRATVAQRIFNAVAKANPYVLLATAIGSVIGAIYLFTRGSKEQEEQVENTNKELLNQADILNKLVSGYDALNKRTISYLEDNIDLLKTQGASVEEVRAAEDALYQAQVAAHERERETLQDEINAYDYWTAKYEANTYKLNNMQKAYTQALIDGHDASAESWKADIEALQKLMDEEKKHIDLVNDFNSRDISLAANRRKQIADREREDAEAARKAADLRKKAYEDYMARLKEAREATMAAVKELDAILPKTVDDLYDRIDERNKKTSEMIQHVIERVGLLGDEVEKIDRDRFKCIFSVGDGSDMEDDVDKMKVWAETYNEIGSQIQETSTALESSFSSLSAIYQQMAKDESKTESEREAAAKKAKAWSKIQIAANAGTAVAKGVASAVDVGFPAAIPAMATMLAAILSAIAQAKALAADTGYETGGVIGGYRGASMGKDNAIASVRTGEMVINAQQQKQLFDIANGGATSSFSASLVEALQAMPAPVLVYSEFQQFTDRVAMLDDAAKLK